MKFQFSQLDPQQPISQLTVMAYEMSLYLVRVTINGEQGVVFADDDRPLRFFNAQSIREAFASFEVAQASMVHDSPYEEMVGNPNKAREPMELPFSLAMPY